MKWNYLSQKKVKNIDQLLKTIIGNRQIDDEKEFFNPTNPLEIKAKDYGIDEKQLAIAVKRVQQAVANQEQVLIYGDYDADGICATAILWLTLRSLGLEAKPFIPDRAKHGYGISIKALKEIFDQQKPDLIITVDNGIVAHEPLEWLKEQKVDVIVTDHHQPSKKPVSALTTVHSTLISGGAVSWVLSRALNEKLSQQLLDLAAVSTVADQMSLLGVNRSLVKYGLQELRNTERVGIKALFEAASVSSKNIGVGTIGFMLAPRINAAGRISQGLLALRLLCTSDPRSAGKLARNLNLLNQERQSLTSEQFLEALKQAQEQKNEKLLFITSPNFHEGVIGLLAGRLTEKFFKPSIVVATDGEVSKASARSVKGVDVTKLIRQVEDELLSVGGHELAAGFSAETQKIESVKDKLLKIAQEEVDAKLLTAQMNIDALVDHSLLKIETVEALNKLEPYGLGNPEPVVALQGMGLVDKRLIGAAKNHLKLALKSDQPNSQIIDALAWRQAARIQQLESQAQLDVACCLEINRWNGKESVQMRLRDFKPAEQSSAG